MKEFPVKSIAELEKRIQYLEKENQYLKNLLMDAGVSYAEKETDDSGNQYDQNQGSRMISRDITEADAKSRVQNESCRGLLRALLCDGPPGGLVWKYEFPGKRRCRR